MDPIWGFSYRAWSDGQEIVTSMDHHPGIQGYGRSGGKPNSGDSAVFWGQFPDWVGECTKFFKSWPRFWWPFSGLRTSQKITSILGGNQSGLRLEVCWVIDSEPNQTKLHWFFGYSEVDSAWQVFFLPFAVCAERRVNVWFLFLSQDAFSGQKRNQNKWQS